MKWHAGVYKTISSPILFHLQSTPSSNEASQRIFCSLKWPCISACLGSQKSCKTNHQFKQRLFETSRSTDPFQKSSECSPNHQKSPQCITMLHVDTFHTQVWLHNGVFCHLVSDSRSNTSFCAATKSAFFSFGSIRPLVFPLWTVGLSHQQIFEYVGDFHQRRSENLNAKTQVKNLQAIVVQIWIVSKIQADGTR